LAKRAPGSAKRFTFVERSCRTRDRHGIALGSPPHTKSTLVGSLPDDAARYPHAEAASNI
jgi:hypothetical protein